MWKYRTYRMYVRVVRKGALFRSTYYYFPHVKISKPPAGKNFHETATISGFWNVLGHINGNALYNNADPGFTEYVEYTKMRWG